MVEDIEADLQQKGHMEVHTSALGAMVMERLRELDRVAYIRYASVYRDFQDIESFEQAVRDLREENPQLPLLDMPPASPKKTRRRAAPTDAKIRRSGANRLTGASKNGSSNSGSPEARQSEPQGDLLNER
jgi:hypothetical protein